MNLRADFFQFLNTRTCLAKENQAGSYIRLRLKGKRQFNQGV